MRSFTAAVITVRVIAVKSYIVPVLLLTKTLMSPKTSVMVVVLGMRPTLNQLMLNLPHLAMISVLRMRPALSQLLNMLIVIVGGGGQVTFKVP